MVLNWAYAHKESNFQRSCSSILFEKFTSLTPLCTWNMNEAKVSQNIYVRLRWTGLLTQRILLKQKSAKNNAAFLKIVEKQVPKILNSQYYYLHIYLLFLCIFVPEYYVAQCAFAFLLTRKVKGLAVNQKAHNYQKKLYLRAMIF